MLLGGRRLRSSFGDWRAFEGFATVEHSVYVRAQRSTRQRPRPTPDAKTLIRTRPNGRPARHGRRHRKRQPGLDPPARTPRLRHHRADAASGRQIRPLARPDLYATDLESGRRTAPGVRSMNATQLRRVNAESLPTIARA